MPLPILNTKQIDISVDKNGSEKKTRGVNLWSFLNLRSKVFPYHLGVNDTKSGTESSFLAAVKETKKSRLTTVCGGIHKKQTLPSCPAKT